MAQDILFIIAIILVAVGIGLFFAGRRCGYKGSYLMILLVFVAVLFSSIQPVSAQTANCAPTTTEQPAIGLQLIDDTQAGQINDTVSIPVVANDLFPGGDPIDWGTLDLIPQTEDIDTFTHIYLPSDPSYICGYASVDYENYGENIPVYIYSVCTDINSNTLPLTSLLTFRYTARTQGGVQAPAPATVTITLEGVYAFDHDITLSGGSLSSDTNVASDAVTFVGTIDSDSVDLDPSTPGRQTTITIEDIATPDIDLTLQVDSNGVVTATLSDSGDLACTDTELGSYPYTIENTANTQSNQVMINVFYDDNCG